jgi:hypothetical protein
MKTLKIITLVLLSVLLVSCNEFSSEYSNIIEDDKVRPIAVVLDKPEAAPGDTVHVKLHYYDAGKDVAINWQVALDYSINNYSSKGEEKEVRELDNYIIPGGTEDEFSFVVPKGAENPLLLSSMLPDAITGLGTKSELIDMLDNMDGSQIPADVLPFIDNFLCVIVLRATLISDMELSVTKRLTVRYSNKVDYDLLGRQSYVNTNPQLNRIGIVTLNKKDATYYSDKAEILSTEPQFFDNLASTVDTFIVEQNKSYFLIADTSGAYQNYLSPEGNLFKEQLFYGWFYTNLDDSDRDWKDLIEIGESGVSDEMYIVKLDIPEDRNMHNFLIRTVVRDYRPEWGVLAARGCAYIEAKGYFEYK